MEAACSGTSTAAQHGDVVGGGGVLLSRHMAFLTGVLSLHSAAAAAGQRSAATTRVVASTVQLVLDAVLRQLDDHDDVMPHTAAVHAVSVVARVCDVTDDDAVCDVVQQFARDVVANVMNNHLFNQVIIWSSTASLKHLLFTFYCSLIASVLILLLNYRILHVPRILVT